MSKSTQLAVDSINNEWRDATDGMSLDDEQSVLVEVKDSIEARLDEITDEQEEDDTEGED